MDKKYFHFVWTHVEPTHQLSIADSLDLGGALNLSGLKENSTSLLNLSGMKENSGGVLELCVVCGDRASGISQYKTSTCCEKLFFFLFVCKISTKVAFAWLGTRWSCALMAWLGYAVF